MIRYACLLVVISVVAVAQPTRLWKLDEHRPSRVLRCEDDGRTLYIGDYLGMLNTWDVAVDTITRRVETPARPIKMIGDTAALVHEWRWCAIVDTRDGHIIKEIDDSNWVEWCDPTGTIGAGVVRTEAGEWIVFTDLKTLEVVWKEPWGVGYDISYAYDDVNRRVIFATRDQVYVMGWNGAKIKKIDVPIDPGYNCGMMVTGGNTLLMNYCINFNLPTIVKAYDLSSYQFVDSLSFDFGEGFHAVRGDSVLYVSEGRWRLLRVNPLRCIDSIIDRRLSLELYYHAMDSIYIVENDRITRLDLIAQTLEDVLPTRHPVHSLTQLLNGEVAITRDRESPSIVDPNNGTMVRPFLNDHPWVSTLKGGTVRAATAAEVVAVCIGNKCELISYADNSTACMIAREPDMQGVLYSPFWLDSLGTSAVYHYYAVDGYYYDGLRMTAKPCKDDTLRTHDGGLLMYSDSLVWERITQADISSDGSYALVSTTHIPMTDTLLDEQQVRWFTALSDVPPFGIPGKVYRDATNGRLLNANGDGVIDDENGLAIINISDTTLHRVVDLGERHYPRGVMSKGRRVVTYASKGVHCVDLETSRIIWTIPVHRAPTMVRFDRDEKWIYLATRYYDSEMYSLENVELDVHDDLSPSQLRVHPNPASETLSVQAPFPMHICEVYDVLGNVVLTLRLNEASQASTLKVDELPKGTYVLSATAGVRRATTLVQKQ